MNIHDVARRANVSSGTVSRVLNDHANIDEDLRRRVLHAVTELGYVPRRARERPTPRAASAWTIGFILIQEHRARDLLGSFWAPILEGAEREARRHGATIIYRPVSPDGVAGLGGDIERSGLDAVLLVGPTPVASVRDILRTERPVELVARHLGRAGGGQCQAVERPVEAAARRRVTRKGLAHRRRMREATSP